MIQFLKSANDEKKSVWLYHFENFELRVSLTDPDSAEHEFGKNEFSVPYSFNEEVQVVNTIRAVLQALGINVFYSE